MSTGGSARQRRHSFASAVDRRHDVLDRRDVVQKVAEVAALLDAIEAGGLLAERPADERAGLKHEAAVFVVRYARERLRVLEQELRPAPH